MLSKCSSFLYNYPHRCELSSSKLRASGDCGLGLSYTTRSYLWKTIFTHERSCTAVFVFIFIAQSNLGAGYSLDWYNNPMLMQFHLLTIPFELSNYGYWFWTFGGVLKMRKLDGFQDFTHSCMTTRTWRLNCGDSKIDSDTSRDKD